MYKTVWHYLLRNPVEHIFSTEAKSIPEADRLCFQYTGYNPPKDARLIILQRKWLDNNKDYCISLFDDQTHPFVTELEKLLVQLNQKNNS